MSQPNRIDDILNGITPQQPAEEKVEPSAVEEVSPAENESQEDNQAEQGGEKSGEAAEENSEEHKPVAKEPEAKAADEPAAETDEYGLEIPKPRMYSEEEVQRMMRERLARGHNAQPQQQVAQQQAAEGFTPDPESTDSWEVQLDAYIDRRIDKREQKASTEAAQRQETEIQAKFEANFTTGMNKHKDFTATVGKLPITNSMMMALRGHENPATFLYAAAKMQPEEVKRIAAMPDPFMQAKALGELDAKMKKVKRMPGAPAIIKPVTSDVSEKYKTPKNIDNLIQNHAKSKRKA